MKKARRVKAAQPKPPKTARPKSVAKARSKRRAKAKARVASDAKKAVKAQAQAVKDTKAAQTQAEKEAQRRARSEARIAKGGKVKPISYTARRREGKNEIKSTAGIDAPGKPPYHVPSMATIRETNACTADFEAVSFFSGCGGSSLGYKMAGFRVLWANEFIPAAQDTYRANHPDTILDPRDIREIRPEDVLEAIGKERGELDLLDGSPPCASFSSSGKREKGWGRVREYSGTKQRTDDLFDHYIRMVDGIRPKVFVAENVPFLAQGTAVGHYKSIVDRLRGLGYNAKAKILDASWLGVPHRRKRLILVGVRNDIPWQPAFPQPLPYRYSAREAWAGVPSGEKVFCDKYSVGRYWHEIKPGEEHPRRFNLQRMSFDEIAPTVTQFMGNAQGQVKFGANIMHPDECRYPTIPEVKRLCSFPDDFVLTGTFAQQWERLGRAVPPVMMFFVANAIRGHVLIPHRDAFKPFDIADLEAAHDDPPTTLP